MKRTTLFALTRSEICLRKASLIGMRVTFPARPQVSGVGWGLYGSRGASAMPQSRRPTGSFQVFGPFDIPGMPPARAVRVYRPGGRGDIVRPTLYLLDGQNVFEDEGS